MATATAYGFVPTAFGRLRPGDYFVHDAVYGLAKVESITHRPKSDDLSWDAVELVIECRSLIFSDRATGSYPCTTNDLIYAKAGASPAYERKSILRFSGEAVLRTTRTKA
jgi:hypothetical protein